MEKFTRSTPLNILAGEGVSGVQGADEKGAKTAGLGPLIYNEPWRFTGAALIPQVKNPSNSYVT